MNRHWCLVFLVYAAPGFAYYHELSERVFSLDIPEANFGFSISSMSRSSTAMLIVGAPLADNIGDVYACDLTDNDENSCVRVYRNITRFTQNIKYNNTNYWFGASVKGTDGFFVACSPMYIDIDVRINETKNIGTYGHCYKYTDPRKEPNLLSTLTQAMRTEEGKHYELTIDSLGWSTDIDFDDSILVGGPAMISGRIIKIDNNDNSVLYATGLNNSRVSFNFGYSVASGRFLSSKAITAVGSTYGFNGYGKVSFLPDISKRTAMKTITAPVVGSMFGAVLCTATLGTYRQQADLLVGAPTYADKSSTSTTTYNVGAVYVYVAKPRGGVPSLKKKIVGKMSQSFFGSAIISVGDLNGDKLDEIAIGAPYENEGRGAVYLYSGADIIKEGDTNHVQKILPEPTLKTFGYSLTAIKDYDDNGCNELAIGVPGNSKVKLLRCIAAITIELIQFDVQMPGNKGIDEIKKLPVCIKVEFPEKPALIKADINVTIVVQHNGARLNDPIKDGSVTFYIRDRKNKHCQDINLFMSGTTGNYNSKINYGLSATLLNNPTRNIDFDASNVKLTDRSVLSVKGSIWAQECGNSLCVPDLRMNATFTESITYLIGSSESIIASTFVSNIGDVAYDACVRVDVRGVTVPFPPDECRVLESTDGQLLECRPKQLLRKTSPPWNIEEISLDTTKLTNEDKLIEITVTLYNECRSLVVTDQVTEQFHLLADTDAVNVQGRTDEGIDDMVNLTRSDINSQKTFEHVYTISNTGLTNWKNVKMDVIVQKLDFVTSTVSINNVWCAYIKQTDTNVTYYCEIQELNKGAGVEAKVIYQIVSDKLSNIIEKEKPTVHSDIVVYLNEIEKPANVTSQLKLGVVDVPIWIIVAACIIALIILVIIIFILRECGFLTRKNKQELKRVRMSVRRQTIMRQSMHNRPRSEDQEKLVENIAASQEGNKKKKDRRVVVNDF